MDYLRVRSWTDMKPIIAVAAGAILLAACGSSPLAQVRSSPPAVLLVYTTWVADGQVTNGPEPGYRPALSGLTGHDIQSASAALDPTGTTWVININFTQRGAKLFADLTRGNVAACPGDANVDASAVCAQRHLGIWLDLTQADIDSWGSRTYVATVSQPFDLGCLKRASVSTLCPKFVSDPITIEVIAGGAAQLSGNFTQQTANDLAGAINAAAGS
jgi:preprotein translocase subunit SecD